MPSPRRLRPGGAIPLILIALGLAAAPVEARALQLVDATLSLDVAATTDTLSPTALPYTHTQALTVSGTSVAIDYALADDRLALTFDYDYFDPTASIFSNPSASGTIHFVADAPLDYRARGAYTTDNSDSLIVFTFALTDVTTGSPLASYGLNNGDHTPVATDYTLGDSVEWSFGSGSLTGSLVPGHEYELAYVAQWIVLQPSAFHATLALAVPEPARASLVALAALVGLRALLRRHRR